MFCPKCGTRNLDEAKFCFSCGSQLPNIPPSSQAQQPQTSTPFSATQVISPSPSAHAPVVTFNQNYAGFWLRYVASLIDGLILSPPSIVLMIMILPQILSPNFSQRDLLKFSGIINVFNIIVFVLNWLYFTLMESSSKQATLGKMALGLMVTDTDGKRLSFGKATGRYFGKILSQLILNIGYLMVAFTEKKQGLHDMIAGTLVVKKR